jgi:hypothetical protein
MTFFKLSLQNYKCQGFSSFSPRFKNSQTFNMAKYFWMSYAIALNAFMFFKLKKIKSFYFVFLFCFGFNMTKALVMELLNLK